MLSSYLTQLCHCSNSIEPFHLRWWESNIVLQQLISWRRILVVSLAWEHRTVGTAQRIMMIMKFIFVTMKMIGIIWTKGWNQTTVSRQFKTRCSDCLWQAWAKCCFTDQYPWTRNRLSRSGTTPMFARNLFQGFRCLTRWMMILSFFLPLSRSFNSDQWINSS